MPDLTATSLANAFVAVACAVSFYFVLRRVLSSSHLPFIKKASSHDAHWLWGHEYQIWRKEANAAHFEWAAKLGPVYRIKAPLFAPDIIVASDAIAASHILQNAYGYEKPPFFQHIVTKFIGRGLVWAEGEEHKRQRRLISPAFTKNAVRDMQDDVYACAEKMVANVKRKVTDEATIANIEPFISGCTLEVIGRVAFAHDFGSGPGSEAEAIEEAWVKDIHIARTFAGFFIPIMLDKFPWIKKLPVKALQNDGITKLIAVKRARDMLKGLRGDNVVGHDVLSMLAREQIKEKGELVEDWRLLENISTLIVAGNETTTRTVVFCLFELARHLPAQDRLRDEVIKLPEFTVDNIVKLGYLDAVTKEALRLYPPAPRTDRIALADDIIPLSKPITTESGERISSFPIKAGQVIQIPFAVINANPNVWGPDGRVFKPERYLSPGSIPPADELPRGPYGNIATFLEGPRVCIGWRLGVMEFKVILASLIREFVFDMTEGQYEQYVSGTVQSWYNGEAACMPLKIHSV